MENDSSFAEIIDAKKIKNIMGSFHQITGIPSTLVDLDGNILTDSDGEWIAAGWQDICLNFHRVNPQTRKNCLESDKVRSNQLKSGEPYSCYSCLNGLVDLAIPVYIDDEAVAHLFTGQFFFEEPDIDFFREQAKKHGFDEKQYLEALDKVPVFSQDFIEKGITFLSNMASIIGEMGLRKKTILETDSQIKESQNRLKILSDHIPGIVYQFLVKKEGIHEIPYISEGSRSLFGLDPEEIEHDVNNFYDLVPPEDVELIINGIQSSIESLTNFDAEFRIQNYETGDIFWLHARSTPQKLPSGDYLWNGVALDVTERKITENALKDSLNEKEVLLSEIHHRVKNNMQIISSLISLQADYFEDKVVSDAFLESKNRIRSMAMIHDGIYRSRSLSSIDFADYIFDLTENLFDTYGVNITKIALKQDVNAFLNLETSIPLGLVINEIVTNSIKHAFPGSATGDIFIRLQHHNGAYSLQVGDNGVGIPLNIDLENSDTLGMQLIYSLLRQLEADVEVDMSNGTAFNIKFRELNYKKRI